MLAVFLRCKGSEQDRHQGKRMSNKSVAEIVGEEGFALPSDMSPALAGLLDYWLMLRDKHGGIPAKSHFDALALKGLWHGLAVMEFDRQSDQRVDLKFRYAGEWLDSLHGCTLVGKTLSQVIDEAEFHRSLPYLLRMSARGQPHYRSGHHHHARDGMVAFERLVTPFSDEAGRADFLVGIWHWPNTTDQNVMTMGGGVHAVSSKRRGPRSGDLG